MNREEIESLQLFKTEEAYRESPSLNYSTLKNIPDGPWCLVLESRKHSGGALDVGNYVDKYFTDRENLELYFDRSKPKIELNASLEALLQLFLMVGVYEPSIDDCVLKCRENGIYGSLVDVEKLKAKFTSDFFEKLKRASLPSDKIELTSDEYDKALSAIENIKSNPIAMEIIEEHEEEIVIPQFKWEFELELEGSIKRKFRVMYDLLKFNFSKKKIYATDIKSGTKPAYKFAEQLIDFRYDIQGILYYVGLMALRKKYFPDWEKCDPQDFKFIYSPKKSNRECIIVPLSEKFIRDNSESIIYNGKAYDGIWKIFNDANWYIENQVFDKHRLLAENNGIVSIDKLI
jgi:hypothetical protein